MSNKSILEWVWSTVGSSIICRIRGRHTGSELMGCPVRGLKACSTDPGQDGSCMMVCEGERVGRV